MTRASTTARYVRPVQGRGAGLTGGLTVPRRSSLASWCSARCSASACAGWRAPACCSATAPTSSRTSQCASGGGSGGSATRRSASACRRRPRRSSPSAHRAARAVHAARITPVFSVSPTLQVSWHRIAPRGHRCRHFSLAPGAAVAVRGALLLPAVGSFICFAVHTPCERSAAAEGVVARCERLTGHNPVGFSLSSLRCARGGARRTMARATAEQLARLQAQPSRIRNLCVLAHVDHGAPMHSLCMRDPVRLLTRGDA